MLYTSKKFKGLGMLRATWEAYIQNFNTCLLLERVNDDIINFCKDFRKEKLQCLNKLHVPLAFRETLDQFRGKKSRLLRDHMRDREFENWTTDYKTRGKGVVLFKEQPYANGWLFNKEGLSSGEWTTLIKMIGEVTNARFPPSSFNQDICCRYCGKFETLAHILGECRHGELLVNLRHNQVRKIFADSLRRTHPNFEVLEEFHCVDESGNNRRVDIILVNNITRDAVIFDPTVRFEKSVDQPMEVDREKKNIYEKCASDLRQTLNLRDIEVLGIMIGSRGTITSFFENIRSRFSIPKSTIHDIVLTVLKGSCLIYNNHIYNNNNPKVN
jgi:hypothetical protein